MTQNQIAYWRLKEDQRSNLAKEAETNRSNLAKEAETYRSNVENEIIGNKNVRAKEGSNVVKLVDGILKTTGAAIKAASGSGATS